MSGTKILIVDDEQRMRKLVRDYLIREGTVSWRLRTDAARWISFITMEISP